MTLTQTTKEIQRLVGAKTDGVYGPNTAARILHSLISNKVEDSNQASPVLEAELDARTLKNLRTLEPKAQKKFRAFIRQAQAIAASYGCSYLGISGTRGKREQNGLYAKGRTKPGRKVTNARYGYSNHNFGIAMDFGVFKGRSYLDNKNPRLAEQVHKAVSIVAPDHGIDWGGSWTGFKDLPHFEVKTGLSMKEKRRKLFDGESML